MSIFNLNTYEITYICSIIFHFYKGFKEKISITWKISGSHYVIVEVPLDQYSRDLLVLFRFLCCKTSNNLTKKKFKSLFCDLLLSSLQLTDVNRCKNGSNKINSVFFSCYDFSQMLLHTYTSIYHHDDQNFLTFIIYTVNRQDTVLIFR